MLVFCMVLLPLAGCAGSSDDESQSAGDTEEVASAEQIFTKNCASCHGGNLEGGRGPSLETVGANLSEEDIADIIENGRGQMPAMKQLSAAEREELASWLADKK